MIASRQIAFGKAAGKRGLSAEDYVQDGLVRQIDGIENASLRGGHKSTFKGWRDLVTGEVYPFSIEGEIPNWQGGECWESVSNSDQRFFISSFPDLATPEGATIEVVTEKTEPKRGVIIGGYGYGGYHNIGSNLEWQLGYKFRAYHSEAKPDFFTNEGTFPVKERLYFASWRSGADYRIYGQEGRVIRHLNNSYFPASWVSTRCNIGSDARVESMCFCGKIFAIRIYNRALTDEEIVHNYEIDKARFGL